MNAKTLLTAICSSAICALGLSACGTGVFESESDRYADFEASTPKTIPRASTSDPTASRSFRLDVRSSGDRRIFRIDALDSDVEGRLSVCSSEAHPRLAIHLRPTDEQRKPLPPEIAVECMNEPADEEPSRRRASDRPADSNDTIYRLAFDGGDQKQTLTSILGDGLRSARLEPTSAEVVRTRALWPRTVRRPAPSIAVRTARKFDVEAAFRTTPHANLELDLRPRSPTHCSIRTSLRADPDEGTFATVDFTGAADCTWNAHVDGSDIELRASPEHG